MSNSKWVWLILGVILGWFVIPAILGFTGVAAGGSNA